ncbi:hypothetical protein FORC066_1318 [Yersinia enterocolitica]|nr:hypothetical protein FORC066_1318 [Yersinia enterocolitica]
MVLVMVKSMSFNQIMLAVGMDIQYQALKLPPKILREFLARGDINKAEYNKLIKGK